MDIQKEDSCSPAAGLGDKEWLSYKSHPIQDPRSVNSNIETIFKTGKTSGKASAANFGQGRPVSASRTEMTELVLPQDSNLLGNILGGRVMHMIDIAGAIAAHRHCHRQVVTASVDHLDFLNPVRVGDLMVLEAQVNRAFHTSVEVGVEVFSEDSVAGVRKHTTTAFLTFVALDDAGKPVPVPPLLVKTSEERRRYREAGVRRNLRLKSRKKS